MFRYWLVFELLWRDFFRRLVEKHGRRTFYRDGMMSTIANTTATTAPNSNHRRHHQSSRENHRHHHDDQQQQQQQQQHRAWSLDADLIRRWRDGRTGVPLIDANMRELAATGWMSNRGRQNVASYLVRH
jgi:deoxyribodipyrimidine photo-lyase